MNICDKDFQKRLINPYRDSWNYSPETYVTSFRKGILNSGIKE